MTSLKRTGLVFGTIRAPINCEQPITEAGIERVAELGQGATELQSARGAKMRMVRQSGLAVRPLIAKVTPCFSSGPAAPYSSTTLGVTRHFSAEIMLSISATARSTSPWRFTTT